MKKIVYQEVERCIDCPYFRDPGISVFCEHPKIISGEIKREEFEIIKNGFPEWCPLPKK